MNKVSTGIELRFEIAASSLPDKVKDRLLKLKGGRITADGVLIIRATEYRSQVKNKESAIRRLHEIVRTASTERKPRRKTQPSKESTEKRLQRKGQRSELKEQRRKPKI